MNTHIDVAYIIITEIVSSRLIAVLMYAIVERRTRTTILTKGSPYTPHLDLPSFPSIIPKHT